MLLILQLLIVVRGEVLTGQVRLIEAIIGKEAGRVLRFRMSAIVKLLLL